MKPKRITITLYDDIPESEVLTYLASWFRIHKEDPEKYPMTGLRIYKDVVLNIREYRKTSCFTANLTADSVRGKKS